MRVGTGSVGAVDDVEWEDGVEEGDEEGDGVEGTRVRRVSAVEIGVGLR